MLIQFLNKHFCKLILKILVIELWANISLNIYFIEIPQYRLLPTEMMLKKLLSDSVLIKCEY